MQDIKQTEAKHIQEAREETKEEVKEVNKAEEAKDIKEEDEDKVEDLDTDTQDRTEKMDPALAALLEDDLPQIDLSSGDTVKEMSESDSKISTPELKLNKDEDNQSEEDAI